MCLLSYLLFFLFERFQILVLTTHQYLDLLIALKLGHATPDNTKILRQQRIQEVMKYRNFYNFWKTLFDEYTYGYSS